MVPLGLWKGQSPLMGSYISTLPCRTAFVEQGACRHSSLLSNLYAGPSTYYPKNATIEGSLSPATLGKYSLAKRRLPILAPPPWAIHSLPSLLPECVNCILTSRTRVIIVCFIRRRATSVGRPTPSSLASTWTELLCAASLGALVSFPSFTSLSFTQLHRIVRKTPYYLLCS